MWSWAGHLTLMLLIAGCLTAGCTHSSVMVLPGSWVSTLQCGCGSVTAVLVVLFDPDGFMHRFPDGKPETRVFVVLSSN